MLIGIKIAHMTFTEKLQALGFKSYADYLRCDHWVTFRSVYFTSHDKICLHCRSINKIQLHHLTYNRLGCERYDDVVPLCQHCHARVHDFIKARAFRLHEAHLHLDGSQPIKKSKANKSKYKKSQKQKRHKKHGLRWPGNQHAYQEHLSAANKLQPKEKQHKKSKKQKREEKKARKILDRLNNKKREADATANIIKSIEEGSVDSSLVIYTDGFLFNTNPSPIGGGYSLVNGDGYVVERTEVLKYGMTCNEAELLGVLRATETSKLNGFILTDSQVVKSWIKRGESKNRADLNDVIIKCKNMVCQNNIMILFVPRNKNLAGLHNARFGTWSPHPAQIDIKHNTPQAVVSPKEAWPIPPWFKK